MEQSAAIDAGGVVVGPAGAATEGDPPLTPLVAVVAGADVVVVVAVVGGDDSVPADCPLGDDEQAAAITVKRASVPAIASHERARTGFTRGTLS